MNIIFDIWIRDDNKVIYTPEEELLFKTIWEYIYDRIAFLIPEMDEEEQINPKRAIVIYLLKRPYAIQPRGYSEKLNERILGCFNENDVELLWKSVETKILGFMN